MFNNIFSVKIIPQLKDNYSYLLKDNNSNSAAVVDPAESKVILNYIKTNNLILTDILITHHHDDHISGIKNILEYVDVPVYSPSPSIIGTTNVVSDNLDLKLKFVTMKVISTPGHTLDHVIYYNKTNKSLFSGDTLFRLGCGRIFEGTYKIMHESLKKIEKLEDDTLVYGGHEYTLNNLKFLLSVFPDNKEIILEKEKINFQILKTKSSMPFVLGDEKKINPFLSSKSSYYQNYNKKNKLGDFELFTKLREKKDNF